MQARPNEEKIPLEEKSQPEEKNSEQLEKTPHFISGLLFDKKFWASKLLNPLSMFPHGVCALQKVARPLDLKKLQNALASYLETADTKRRNAFTKQFYQFIEKASSLEELDKAVLNLFCQEHFRTIQHPYSSGDDPLFNTLIKHQLFNYKYVIFALSFTNRPNIAWAIEILKILQKADLLNDTVLNKIQLIFANPTLADFSARPSLPEPLVNFARASHSQLGSLNFPNLFTQIATIIRCLTNARLATEKNILAILTPLSDQQKKKYFYNIQKLIGSLATLPNENLLIIFFIHPNIKKNIATFLTELSEAKFEAEKQKLITELRDYSKECALEFLKGINLGNNTGTAMKRVTNPLARHFGFYREGKASYNVYSLTEFKLIPEILRYAGFVDSKPEKAPEKASPPSFSNSNTNT